MNFKKMGIPFTNMPSKVDDAAKELCRVYGDAQTAADHLCSHWQLLIHFGISNLIDALKRQEKAGKETP